MFNKKTERTPEQQATIDAQTATVALYHFQSCPFCARVRTAIDGMNLHIEQRDIQLSAEHRQALLVGGGKTQVPALQITHDDGSVEWMYESMDIINYLRNRFA